jgi:Spy/CpxP family protein refolding chaperone
MRNPWKLTTLALVGLLATSAGHQAFTVSSASADVQPKMREALDQLKYAARSLEVADHDKGGHRAKALELTRAAIVQVEEGMKFDNRH